MATKKTRVKSHTRKVNGEKVKVDAHSRTIENNVKSSSKSPIQKKASIEKKEKYPDEFKREVSFVDKEGKNVKAEIEYELLRGNSSPYFTITRDRAGSSGAGGWIPKNKPQKDLLNLQDKYHLKSNIPMELEQKVDVIIEEIEEAEEDNQDDLGLSGWQLKAMMELAEEEEEVFTSADVEDGSEFRVEGAGEYRVFESYDDAYNTAVDNLERDLEDDPETYMNDFFLGYIDRNKAENYFTEVYNEMNYNYTQDIQSESSDRGYENRLVDELIERDIITESKAEEEGYDGSDHIDEFIENMTNDQIDEGGGGYDYYELNFGEDEAKRLAVDNFLIDTRRASEEAVNIDGVGHYLSGYDSNEIELPSGAYAYRN
jgi:hypothetical protein